MYELYDLNGCIVNIINEKLYLQRKVTALLKIVTSCIQILTNSKKRYCYKDCHNKICAFLFAFTLLLHTLVTNISNDS